MIRPQCALVALFLCPAAFAAASTDASLQMAPQTIAQAPDTTPSSARRFSLGLGSGVDVFGGNIGQLYSSGSPAMEVRGEFAFAPMFSARVGADQNKFGFNSAPNGAVDVTLQSLQAAAQWHFLGTALAAAGFDPFFSVGAAGVFRSQTFRDYGEVERDNAVALNAGVGANYFLPASHLGFWAEADAGQVYFADRRSQEYVPGGIPDLSGPLYSARLGVKYLF